MADMAPLPPLERRDCAPDGSICATIVRPEALRPGAFPTLTIRRADRKVGAHALDYVLGPRFFFALACGRIVMVDEWIRRAETAHAIEVYDADGALLARWSFAEAMQAAGQSVDAIREAARFGPFLAAEPERASDGSGVILRMGDGGLTLDAGATRPTLTPIER